MNHLWKWFLVGSLHQRYTSGMYLHLSSITMNYRRRTVKSLHIISIINSPFLMSPLAWWCSLICFFHFQTPWGKSELHPASWRWNRPTWCSSKLLEKWEVSRDKIFTHTLNKTMKSNTLQKNAQDKMKTWNPYNYNVKLVAIFANAQCECSWISDTEHPKTFLIAAINKLQ